MHYFVKYGYSGTEFTGFQHGNGERNVEDVITAALENIGITSGITSAARTDRNVSATGNVFMFSCSGNIKQVLAELNHGVEHMVFHSFAAVQEHMSPRHNDSKVYRYIVFDHKAEELKHHLEKFRGRHDFRAFARVDHRNPVRTIDRIEVTENTGYVTVDFHARSFIWQQIRRIMGFVSYTVSTGQDISPFSDHGIVRLAPPEQLILLDITYDGVEFTRLRSASLEKRISASARTARMNYIFHENMLTALYDHINSSKE